MNLVSDLTSCPVSLGTSTCRLKELLGGTDGNLGAHLRRLEEAAYVEVRKEFQQRRPVSWYRLTRQGREALEAHVRGLRDLLRQARADDGNAAAGPGKRRSGRSKRQNS